MRLSVIIITVIAKISFQQLIYSSIKISYILYEGIPTHNILSRCVQIWEVHVETVNKGKEV